jgi:cytosine/adenosine deaminase-related metal-dependent hydrolase
LQINLNQKMAHRKFKASFLFNGYEMLDDSQVLITDEHAKVLDIVPAQQAGEDIQAFGGILCPGFVNCHCHLELSHMKSTIPEKTGMVNFILSVMKERTAEERMLFEAIESAEDQMLNSGIVAVGDICNNNSTIDQKKKARLHYHNFVEASGFVPPIASQRFNKSLVLFNKFAEVLTYPDNRNSIVPHASYSVSPELLRSIVEFPDNHLLTIHNQESIEEDEFFRYKRGDLLRLYRDLNIDISSFVATGQSSIHSVLIEFRPNQSLILVHNLTTTDQDLAFCRKLSERGLRLYFCLCPNANLYIGNGRPNIEMFIRNNCPIVLGTDSLASNHQLSILEELKTLQIHSPMLSTSELLRWATINGAVALEMDSVLGSFEKGKQPGVVLIENVENGRMTKNSVSRRVL